MRMSFATAAVLIVVAVHAVLLPALYFGLSYVVRRSHERMFIDHARTFARMAAEELEHSANSTARISDLLDLVILNGDGAYAEYVDGALDIRSQLNQAGLRLTRPQDFRFGSSGDHVYFMKQPIGVGRDAELRLGFDERPTEERIAAALRATSATLAAYWLLSLAVGLLLALRLSHSVRRLRAISQRIAHGDYAQRLQLDSPIGELQALASDLDNMRRELVGANERLQSEMRDREVAVQQRQELESRLRHRQRLETVGTLAGGIAHEFNNALLPIILFTESALQEPQVSDRVREDLQRVLTSARRARQVVQKILVFGRKFDSVKLERLDLRAIVADAIKLFIPLVPSDVEVDLRCAETLLPVRADAALVQQLLMNLCVNAYQALGGKAGKVAVELKNLDTAVAHAASQSAMAGVELCVSDSGHGMDAATIERIFEPFFTTREVGQGTGLGLSVVHGIADSFGASISVQSEVGVGTSFRVFFPSAVEADAAASDA
jgi:signal transduction histidine kinase